MPDVSLTLDKRGNRTSEVLLHISGNATYQDLASQNVQTSLLTRDNFRFARQPRLTCQSKYLGEKNGVSHALIIRKMRYHPRS